MKPVTINVSEVTYALFQAEARKRDRTAAELIREAMEFYVSERIHRTSGLDQWQPFSLGGILQDWADGSFRVEMLDGSYRG